MLVVERETATCFLEPRQRFGIEKEKMQNPWSVIGAKAVIGLWMLGHENPGQQGFPQIVRSLRCFSATRQNNRTATINPF
jgi:hypothetical protein